MSYQVRHKEMGIFQGKGLGVGFWHPISGQPEQGLRRFPIREDAEKFIEYYCDYGMDIFKKDMFIIEPFDEKLDFEMRLVEIEEK